MDCEAVLRGRFRYAHLAFPGVAEAAQKEHEAAEQKKKAREAAASEILKKAERTSPDDVPTPAVGAISAALPEPGPDLVRPAACD